MTHQTTTPSAPTISGHPLEVTAEEFSGAEKFISALKPGIYVKCSRCMRLKYNAGAIRFDIDGAYCEGCA